MKKVLTKHISASSSKEFEEKLNSFLSTFDDGDENLVDIRYRDRSEEDNEDEFSALVVFKEHR